MKTVLATLFAFFIATATMAQGVSLQNLVTDLVKDMGTPAASNNDFSFLDPILKDRRIVMLGESSHGTEEYSQVKKQLIQYLHEKLGFKVVLFESPMTNCSYLNAFEDTNATELVRNSIQQIWHTETVRDLFRYMKNSGIQFKGFDPQFMRSPYPAMVYTSAFKAWPAVLSKLLQLEERAATTITSPAKYISLNDSFSTAYAQLGASLEKENLSPFQQWMRQTLLTNSAYYARLMKGNQRDSSMAKNIIWLAENLYKNEKIIIWAHNTHIDRAATASKRNMGKILSDHFKDQLYSIGLYMLNGTTAMNNRSIISVKQAPEGSIEQMLSRSGFRTAFIQTNNTAFNRRMPTLHWGKSVQKMNLYKSFDAVILVNGVSAPVYLPR